MIGNLLWKIFGNRFGAVVLGLILLAVAQFGLSDDKVMCGSQVMSRLDKCVTTYRGSSTTRTYEEERASQRRMRIGLTVLGGLFVVGGAAAIVIRLVRRKPEPTVPTPPPAGPPMAGPPMAGPPAGPPPAGQPPVR